MIPLFLDTLFGQLHVHLPGPSLGGTSLEALEAKMALSQHLYVGGFNFRPLLGSVWLRFTHGTVLAIPVFGSDKSAGQRSERGRILKCKFSSQNSGVSLATIG